MKLINGIYEGSPKSRSRNPHKCLIYVHVRETAKEWIFSWSAAENKRYYGGTYWEFNNIMKVQFNPFKECMKRQPDGSYEFRVSKSTGDKYVYITQGNVFWYHPPTGHWSFGFILVEKC